MQQYCFIYHIQLKTVPFYARNPPFQWFLPLFYLFVGCLVFVCSIRYLWSKVVTVQYVTYSRFCVQYPCVFFYLTYKLLWKNTIFNTCKKFCNFMIYYFCRAPGSWFLIQSGNSKFFKSHHPVFNWVVRFVKQFCDCWNCFTFRYNIKHCRHPFFCFFLVYIH